VANPEGVGEHIRVAPGRADAPVPFEFARVMLCADAVTGTGASTGADGPRPGCGFDVMAPRHDYLTAGGGLPGITGVGTGGEGADGGGGADDSEDWLFDPFPCPYPLDHTCRYFLVLAALCEAGLHTGDAEAPVPTTEELTERLRPVWPEVSPAAVSWNLDYLRLKLRLRTPPDGGTTTREALARFALRFDLVHEGHLAVLAHQLV
jgi:hypothetical protein